MTRMIVISQYLYWCIPIALPPSMICPSIMILWPFFICVIGAAWLLLANRRLRGRVLLAGTIVGVYLVFGCSYYMWSGGSSFGPRHVVPCLPFAAYLVVRGYDSIVRWLAPPLTVLSLALVTISVSTLAEFPEPIETPLEERWNPLLRIALPRFLEGWMSIKLIGPEGQMKWWPLTPEETQKALLEKIIGAGGLVQGQAAAPLAPDDPLFFYDACNAGEMSGLRGLPSLLPLAGVWLILGSGLLWASRADRQVRR